MIERVLVHGIDVTWALDLEAGAVDWTTAIRAAYDHPGAATLEVRYVRVDGWSEDGTHGRYTVAAGERLPEGNAEGVSWVSRCYKAEVFRRPENEEKA